MNKEDYKKHIKKIMFKKPKKETILANLQLLKDLKETKINTYAKI